MSRPKNKKRFRLFKRKLDGWELFYVRILDEEGNIIATRSTGPCISFENFRTSPV